MKKPFAVFIFALLPLFAFGIDGRWLFENMLFQTISNGSASVVGLKDSLLVQIEFTNKVAPSKKHFKSAKVQMHDLKSDKLVTYEAIYRDDSARADSVVITLGVDYPEKFTITIYLAVIDERTYWYSYGIAPETINTYRVEGSIGKPKFVNFIGKLRRDS